MYWYDRERLDINTILGKTLTNVNASDDVIEFETSEGDVYRMYHEQDCCESVYVEDIVGDLEDLIGEPLVEAEEVSDEAGALDKWDDSYTWTFYKLRTKKGCVTIRWYGSSNGYYSESVDFIKV